MFNNDPGSILPSIVRDIDRLGRKLQRYDSLEMSGDRDDGWIRDSRTWVYVSSTSFKIVGVNTTSLFPVGTKIRLKQGGTYKYFYVIGNVFSTDTTITVTGGSEYALTNATITSNYFSHSEVCDDFPAWMYWSPTMVGWSSNPPNGFYRFSISGKTCTVTVRQASTGVSDSTSVTFTAPVPAASINSNEYWGAVMWGGRDNNAALTTPGMCYIQSGSSTISCFKDQSGAGWTASSNKAVNFTLSYEIHGYYGMSGSASMSPSASLSPSGSPSISPSGSLSPSSSGSASGSKSGSRSASASLSASASQSQSGSKSASSSGSASGSASPSPSPGP